MKMDFIKINYTGRVEDGDVFDTTDEGKAKEANIYEKERVYKPLSVAVGEGQVIKGLDEALAKMKVGDKKEVVCIPEMAYGIRNPALVRLVPTKFFKQQKINPIPGMPVEIDNMRGRVQTVSGGRVRVDFNPELAGKTLVFDVEVMDKASNDKEKVDYLIERNFEGLEGLKVNLNGKKLSVDLPKKAFHDRNLMVRKASLSAETSRFLELDEVTFTETWVSPKKEAKSSDKKEGKTPQKKEAKKKDKK